MIPIPIEVISRFSVGKKGFNIGIRLNEISVVKINVNMPTRIELKIKLPKYARTDISIPAVFKLLFNLSNRPFSIHDSKNLPNLR